MSAAEPTPLYLAENRQAAEHLLIFLQSRRILRDRVDYEQYEECRKSAHALRGVLEMQMLTVKGGGFLREALDDMQVACTKFVSAAGNKSINFKQDDELFQAALAVLRTVFAQRVASIVDTFGLHVNEQITAIIRAQDGW